jgi:hypothetical protein
MLCGRASVVELMLDTKSVVAPASRATSAVIWSPPRARAVSGPPGGRCRREPGPARKRLDVNLRKSPTACLPEHRAVSLLEAPLHLAVDASRNPASAERRAVVEALLAQRVSQAPITAAWKIPRFHGWCARLSLASALRPRLTP